MCTISLVCVEGLFARRLREALQGQVEETLLDGFGIYISGRFLVCHTRGYSNGGCIEVGQIQLWAEGQYPLLTDE